MRRNVTTGIRRSVFNLWCIKSALRWAMPQRSRKRTNCQAARQPREGTAGIVFTVGLDPSTHMTYNHNPPPPQARDDPLPPISTSTFSAVSGDSAKVKNGWTHCGHPTSSLHLPPSSHQGIVLPFALPSPATPCSARVFSSVIPFLCDIKQAWAQIISPWATAKGTLFHPLV